jgi:hypothetical protein
MISVFWMVVWMVLVHGVSDYIKKKYLKQINDNNNLAGIL